MTRENDLLLRTDPVCVIYGKKEQFIPKSYRLKAEKIVYKLRQNEFKIGHGKYLLIACRSAQDSALACAKAYAPRPIPLAVSFEQYAISIF